MTTDFNRDYLHFSVPVAVAEEILGLHFAYYENKDTGRQLAKAIGPITVPQSVKGCVDTIVGVSGFPVERFVVVNTDPDPDDVQVTPAVLRKRYNVTNEPVNPNNQQSVAEFQGQFISQSDVCLFYQQFNLTGNCNIHRYIGKNDPTNPGIESSLDVDYIQGLQSGVPLDYYIFPGMDFCGDLLNWTYSIGKQSAPGWVHSVSYGAQYYDPICDESVEGRLDEDFQKLNLRGLTFVIASGDSGSGYYSRVGYNNGYLVPSWPSSSPFCTAVGSTAFYYDKLNVEQATIQFGSGGGFDWQHTTPSFQKATIDQFFKDLPAAKLSPAKSFNRNGRATPDVACLGENFVIIMDGSQFPGVGGTSASTPTFAGMVSHLNDRRLNKGKKTLGNINELIYQHPEAFYDVTLGSDKIGLDTVGWDCVKGWDPVTGLGTPDYSKLEKIIDQLP
jgi:tripeptidyl-peptidase-1